MKKILITGSNGFIGQELYHKFNGEHAVYRYNRNKPQEYADKDFHVIIHCAANSVIRENGPSVWDSNVKLTHEILETFTRRNIVKPIFINLSSIAVYGNYYSPPTEDNPCYPETVYGMSKLASEFIVGDYHKQGKIYATTLRLGGVCGPKMTHGIIKKMVQHFKDGKESIDFINPAPGNNMSYVHIDTVCELVNYLIDIDDWNETQDIYNVTATNTMTIQEIVGLFNKVLNKDMKINWIDVPGFVNDNSIFIGDVSKVLYLVNPLTTALNLERTIKACFA